ncbi:MAG TPA: thioesterase family protein [Polaromonas sp.]|uniref:thioesterase family protein n=1 Tax=Polaromonas sp. TaxID=1869339 RepID=UPI002D3B02C1|nr:thioesterase family protein [Polaromonas sp.]HYW57526.1 thioesterase family protein [Polaromonas sp.]
MSGLFRNLITLLLALRHFNRLPPLARTSATFFITPFDTGITTLKSDRYLLLAEAAQIDYMVKTGLLKETLRNRYNFVNAAQMVKFIKPVRLFNRVRVETQVAYADDKCAWFCHGFYVGEAKCAEVLVKMKFKRGRVTVAPGVLLGEFVGVQPVWIGPWEATLTA